MIRWACLVFLTLPGVLLGLAPEPPFTFPTNPVPPPPPPTPGAVPVLTPDLLYVVNGNGADSFVLVDPPGLVQITKHKGPITFRGKFIDKPTVVESRTFPGPVVYEVTAVGTGRAYLNFVVTGAKSEADVGRATIDVGAGQAPQPPPNPPAPTEKPAWVIVVEETSQRTPAAALVLNDLAMWNRLEAKGVQHRAYDKDSPDAKAKKYDVFAAQVGLPAVLLLDKDGKVIDKFPLPRTAAELEAKVGAK